MEEQGIEQEKKERIRRAENSKLPVLKTIDAIDDDTRKRVAKLLSRSTELVVKRSEIKEEIDEVESELAVLCEVYSLPGVRDGLNSFEYFGWKTKKTLSKEALLALGVPAATIELAYVDSKPFQMIRINPFDIE